MMLVESTDLDDIELYHKPFTSLVPELNYRSELIFIPFIYTHGNDDNIRRLVLLWSFKFEADTALLLSIQTEDSCIIHSIEGQMQKHEFAKILVNYSFAKITSKYKTLVLDKSIKYDLEIFINNIDFVEHYRSLLSLFNHTWHSL